MAVKFFLLTETNFHATYLAAKWIQRFDTYSGFMGIALREDAQFKETMVLRENLHREFQGQRNLSSTALQQFKNVYPNFSQTDLMMLQLFGVPSYAATLDSRTIFLGPNLNSHSAGQWLASVSKEAPPVFFIFLDQLLQSWWIEYTHSQIINGHSALLPYARGMYAIENIAITQDIESFTRAAGASIHYIDTGIDTGPIIKTEQFEDPLGFDSLWEVKAHSFQKVFDLLIQTAEETHQNQCLPCGKCYDPMLRGPNFNSRDFTPAARQKAVDGYLKMKAKVQLLSGTR